MTERKRKKIGGIEILMREGEKSLSLFYWFIPSEKLTNE